MDLRVDGTLDDTSNDLKKIHDEFSNAKKHAEEDGWIWGQWDLGHAMNEFVDNWWVHREKMDKRLTDLSDQVAKAVQGWSDADKQLSDSLGKTDA